MLIGIKMIKKKKLTELGHSEGLKIYVNPSKIYVNPGIYVHSNDLFSETTAPMVLNFHMQHDKAAGLQNDQIPAGWESRWLLLLKIAKPLKSNFLPEPLNIFG